MTVALKPPNKILITPTLAHIFEGNDADGLGVFASSAAGLLPGMLVEIHDDGGVNNVRAHDTVGDVTPPFVAIEPIITGSQQPTLQIEQTYAVDDQVTWAAMRPGCVFFGLIPSGQDISNSELLESNGDGKLRTAAATTAAAGTARFQSLDNPGAVLVDTRIRTRYIG